MIVIKKSMVLVFVLMILCICTAISVPAFSPKPSNEFVVVIDAGHGGRDGGAVGVLTDAYEKDLNLTYAYCLKELLTSNGISVVMTRTDGAGLYQEIDGNKKLSDMQEREKIIADSNANLFVSIHMNSFSLSSAKGSQVFYESESSSSKEFAELTQTSLKKIVPLAKAAPKIVDFYLLHSAPCPAILVECGYLSNPEEDALLATQTHREKICYALFCGIYAYLNLSAT